jgi:hypothetical protein
MNTRSMTAQEGAQANYSYMCAEYGKTSLHAINARRALDGIKETLSETIRLIATRAISNR